MNNNEKVKKGARSCPGQDFSNLYLLSVKSSMTMFCNRHFNKRMSKKSKNVRISLFVYFPLSLLYMVHVTRRTMHVKRLTMHVTTSKSRVTNPS